MRLQGWNITALTEFSAKQFHSENACPIGTDTSIKEGSISAHQLRDESEPRVELLNKIRKKISSGFYNSESVIEDIGYGFAQALDNSI